MGGSVIAAGKFAAWSFRRADTTRRVRTNGAPSRQGRRPTEGPPHYRHFLTIELPTPTPRPRRRDDRWDRPSKRGRRTWPTPNGTSAARISRSRKTVSCCAASSWQCRQRAPGGGAQQELRLVRGSPVVLRSTVMQDLSATLWLTVVVMSLGNALHRAADRQPARQHDLGDLAGQRAASDPWP